MDRASQLESLMKLFLEKILSIVITAAILKLVQAILDIILSWKARKAMKSSEILRYVLKVVVAAA